MVKNTLRKKLLRDMSRAAMQFLSIIVLCALGTFAFAALDGTARMTRVTQDTYFEENNLADFWISLPSADRASLDKVAAIPGIRQVRARASTDLETTLEGDVSVSVTAYDGRVINIDVHGCPGSKAFVETYTPTPYSIQAPLRSEVVARSNAECLVM